MKPYEPTNRLADKNLAVMKIVVIADELHVRRNHRAVLNRDSATRHHQTIRHNHDVFADVYHVEAHTF